MLHAAVVAMLVAFQQQNFEGVQVIASDNARLNVIVTKDSAWLSMLMPDHSSFVVRTDSVTMATWADNADLLTDTTHGARLAYMDSQIGRLQAITFVRLQPSVPGDRGGRSSNREFCPSRGYRARCVRRDAW
jgi:hypothetical protein